MHGGKDGCDHTIIHSPKEIRTNVLIGTVYRNSSFSTNCIVIVFSRSSPKDHMGTLTKDPCKTHHSPMCAYPSITSNNQ